MTQDPSFWVAVSFVIFFVGLLYLKVPQKTNIALDEQIKKIKDELREADELKVEAKNLLSNYENKIDKSKKEVQEIINLAKKESEKNIIEKTKKFHTIIENKKKDAELKIVQMQENALRDIKNKSVKVSIETVKHLIKNSIDNVKLEKLYSNNIKETKEILKHTKI